MSVKEGWQPGTPHGFISIPLVAVRSEPTTRAKPLYYLKGGVRVPILEQTDDWWKVQWPGKPAGWIRSGHIQPHSDLILIDLETGRFLRRIATMGELGHLVDWKGQVAYSSAKTGPSLSRTTLTGRTRAVTLTMIPVQEPLPSAGHFNSTAQRMMTLLRSESDKTTPGALVNLKTGVCQRRFTVPGPYYAQLSPLQAGGVAAQYGIVGPMQRLSWNGDVMGTMGVKDNGVAVASNGAAYTIAPSGPPKKRPTLFRTAAGGIPKPLAALPKADTSNYTLTAFNERLYVLVPLSKAAQAKINTSTHHDLYASNEMLILDAATGKTLRRFPWSDDYSTSIVAETPQSIYVTEGDADVYSRIDARTGRKRGDWTAAESTLAVGKGRILTVGDQKGAENIEMRNLATGAMIRKIPILWRPPGYRKFTPFQTGDGMVMKDRSPLEVSSIQISPNGKQALLTEYLNGDAGG